MAEAKKMRNGCAGACDEAAIWRRTQLFIVILLGVFFAACSSKAKVQYESLERTETQDKINTVGNSAETSELFKKLYDQLNEEERKPLNAIVSVIIDRTPSKAEKNSTLLAVLKAAESIRGTTALRANLNTYLEQILELSKVFDESLKNIAEALFTASGDAKPAFLSQAELLRKRSNDQAEILSNIEMLLPKVSPDGILASSSAWGSLPADPATAKDYLEVLFKIAGLASAQDVAKWIARTKDANLTLLLLQGIRPVSATDTQLAFLVKVQNVLSQETLLIFNTLMAAYTSDATPQNTKTSLAEALKKSLVLKSQLHPPFFALSEDSLKRPNHHILLNALADSIDRTGGEGFFLQPQYTTRNLSAFSVPSCIVPGSSNDTVTFSFRWKKNGNVVLESTPPSTIRQSSAGVLFELDSQAQCSARVFVDGNEVAELNSELVTVRSVPPIFTSGEPPQAQSFSVKKAGSFIYKVNDQDPITEPNTFYRLTALPLHGSVRQTEVGTFEYHPLGAYTGNDSFKFVACNPDDVCSPEKLVSFTVSEGNLSPKLELFIIPLQNRLATGIIMSQSAALNGLQLVIGDDDIFTSSCAVPNVIVTSGNLAIIPQANIEISGTFPFCKLKLTPASGLGSATLTLKLDDQINPPVISTLSVTVISPTPSFVSPEAPTSFTVNKNSGANTLQLSALVDPDAALFATPQTTSYTVTSAPALGSVSAASTVPSAGFGSITYTTPIAQPNTQVNQTTSFSYRACDNASPANCSPTRAVSVNIVNNPPTVSAITNLSFNEDSLSTVQNFTISDPDDTRSCTEFNSAGNKTSSDTAIIPVSGIIIGGTAPNCTVQIDSATNSNGGSVTITLSLPHSTPVQRSFTVTVLPVNDPPTAIQLSNATIVENNLANAFIGTLSTTDPDAGDSFTYSLGGADAASFSISGSNLLINAPADFDTKSSFNITITSTDVGGLSTAAVPFVINVININEAPVFASTGDTLVQVSEQEANRTITLATVTDVDNTALTAQLVGSVPSSGTLTGFPVALTSGGTAQTVTYAPAAGQLGLLNFQYRVCDAAPLCTEVKTVSIEVLGKTPVLNGAALNSSFNVATSASVAIALDGVLDPDAVRLGQNLTYTVTLTNSLGTAPTGFAAATTGTGSVNFTAGASSGVEILKYKACDSNSPPNCSAEKSVTINIGTANSPFEVSAGSRSVAIGIAETGTVTLGQFADPTTPSAALVYVVTQNAARLSSVGGLNPASGTPQTVTYTRPDQAAGTEVVAYKACTTGVTPQRCSPEIVFEVSRTTNVVAPALTGGDSLVVVSETVGTGGGSVNISLAGAKSVGHPEFTLTYSLLQGPQNRSGVALVDGPVATLATLPANANATTTTVSYTLRNDLFAGTSDQIVYQVCQNSTPILCTSRTVSIAVIAANDPTTGTISTLDSNTPPLKLTGAEHGSKTFNMNLTLADSDTAVACNSVTIVPSAPSLIAASTVSGTGPCTFTLTSSAGLSGDADISLQLGGSTMKINMDQTSFRTSVLALDNSTPKRAIHICNGSSVTVGQGPDSPNQTINGIAACKDFIASGWDATVELNANQYFRSIDRSKLPDPRNYCIGFKLFGFQGMALCGNGSEPLNLHRDVGTLLVNASTAPAAGYRLFPDSVKDHDGQTVGTSGIKKLLRRPANPCGTSGANVGARIADCATQNPSTSFWDGSVKGNTGQGLWRLVTVKAISDGDCASGCSEVWRDERTGLLWSDEIVDNSADAVDTYNWCRASGNSNAAHAPSQENDATCANATNQNQTTPTSLCAEDDIAPSVFATLDVRQLLSLGELRLGTTPKVRWWLPSRADYLRAERHGLRFVLPNIGNEFWTATVSSAASGNAWTFDGGAGGKLSTAARTANKKVRCVGSP